jgi:ABC-type polysaccharide/polyol phosphate export permease
VTLALYFQPKGANAIKQRQPREQIHKKTAYIRQFLVFLISITYFLQKFGINLFNPFFYMIDGFRYSLTDHVDGNIEFGMIVLLVSNVLVFMLLVRLLNIGWRIKS